MSAADRPGAGTPALRGTDMHDTIAPATETGMR
jgi:hypothetical protein